MNTRLLAAAVLATASLVSASAFADAQYADNAAPAIQSQGLTRADVRADLQRARASGQLDQSLQTYPSLLQQSTGNRLTRADVRAQLGTAGVASDSRS